MNRTWQVHHRTGRDTRRATGLIVAAVMLGACSATGSPAPTRAGTPAPAPLLYTEFGPRFERMDNLHEACRAPSQRCSDGIAAVGALARDLRTAIARHPDPAVYAEVSRVLSRIADTVRRSPSGRCAIEIRPATTPLCAAQGTILAVDIAVADDELKKAEDVPG